MAALIIIFLVLLMLLTGTFLSVLGIVGWFALFIFGAAIIYLGVVAPVRARFAKSEQSAVAASRAELGYGGAAEKSPEEQKREALGYGGANEREI